MYNGPKLVEGGPHENWELWPPADSGEIRRLTILSADLVDSTALSTRRAGERQTQLDFVSSFMVEGKRINNNHEWLRAA